MLLLLAALLALTALVAACSDDSDDSDAEMATMEGENADAGAMIAALSVLDNTGLHDINLTLVGDDPAIDAAWLGAVRNSRTAVGAIHWPDELQEMVDAYMASSSTLEDALADDDVAAAAEIVGQTHADFHALSSAGWDHLAETAGTTMSGHADHNDEEHSDE